MHATVKHCNDESTYDEGVTMLQHVVWVQQGMGIDLQGRHARGTVQSRQSEARTALEA
jgi:hypothetical protein